MSDLIDVGEIVRVTNGDGFQLKPAMTLFDPSVVTLTVKSPSGSVTLYEEDVLQNDSVGLWHYDLTADEAGRWHFKWDGDQVIEQGYFYVVKDEVGEAESS